MIKGGNGKGSVIQINPEDMDIVRNYWDDLRNEGENIQTVDFQSNPAIERGGCIIETPNETIDARINRQLDLMGALLEEGMNNAGNVELV